MIGVRLLVKGIRIVVEVDPHAAGEAWPLQPGKWRFPVLVDEDSVATSHAERVAHGDLHPMWDLMCWESRAFTISPRGTPFSAARSAR